MTQCIRCRHAGPTIALMALMLGSSSCDIQKAIENFDLCEGGLDGIASVTLEPVQVNLRVGDMATLAATRIGTNGQSILLCAPPWSWDSANPSVATISATDVSGVVRAVAVGTTVVSARSGGKSGSSSVTVSAAAIASLAIEPQQLVLRVGQTIRLAVSARDSAGNSLTVRAIAWSSDDQAIATVSSTGLLAAVESGTASVRATVEKMTVVARIPVNRDAPAVRLQQISAGYMHTCAIAEGEGVPEGSAYCWGSAESGRLGNGGSAPSEEPIRVAGGQAYTAIAAGQNHTCGISTNGATYCWGGNQAGQLGDGRQVPAIVQTSVRFSSLAAAGGFTCGVSDGGAYCLGGTYLLGFDGPDPEPRPIPDEGRHRFAKISGGGFHACAIDITGAGWCWGRNYEGQLSGGEPLVYPTTPRQVLIR